MLVSNATSGNCKSIRGIVNEYRFIILDLSEINHCPNNYTRYEQYNIRHKCNRPSNNRGNNRCIGRVFGIICRNKRKCPGNCSAKWHTDYRSQHTCFSGHKRNLTNSKSHFYYKHIFIFIQIVRNNLKCGPYTPQAKEFLEYSFGAETFHMSLT